MNAMIEQALISKLRTLSPQQVAEVEDFVEFLAAKAMRSAALDRLLAVAPALEAVGVEPISEDEIAAEVKACSGLIPPDTPIGVKHLGSGEHDEAIQTTNL